MSAFCIYYYNIYIYTNNNNNNNIVCPICKASKASPEDKVPLSFILLLLLFGII